MRGLAAGAGTLVGRRLGKYEIVALLAVGGTAEIYLARIGGAAGFEKYVVVKCLHEFLADDAEFVDMFLDEARLCSHLDHSNIVQVHELGQHEGRYYIAMEYLPGLSLAMVARRAIDRVPGGRIPQPVVLAIAVQACAGLHYAHERVADGQPLHIVHRDISPQNLVISFEGIVKLVDFGIAKADVRASKTRSGTIKGKFAYMSPEQCRSSDVDRRTDVFALGVVIHELLTARRLFKRASAYETYQAVIEGVIPRPSQLEPSIDAELDELVLHALAYDREHRFPTAEALGEAIAGYLHRQGHHISTTDLADFFETYYQRELTDHATRMRALMTGREAVPVSQWDAEADSGIAKRMPDDEAEPTGIEDQPAGAAVEPGPPAELAEPDSVSTSAVVLVVEQAASTAGEIGSDAALPPAEDAPEATSIESQPLGAQVERAPTEAPAPSSAGPRVAQGKRRTSQHTAPPPPEPRTRAPSSPPVAMEAAAPASADDDRTIEEVPADEAPPAEVPVAAVATPAPAVAAAAASVAAGRRPPLPVIAVIVGAGVVVAVVAALVTWLL